MKFSLRSIPLLVVITLLTIQCVWAQNACELTLNQAQEEFNNGHFYAIPALLKGCLDQNQTREWNQRAYLLLAETYLLLEDPIGAEDSYLKVLMANPEFIAEKDREPIDLVYLSSKFTATPIFSLYGRLGGNVSPISVIHDVDIGGESITKEKNKLRVGWSAAAGVDFNYSSRLAFATELNYSVTGFKHVTTNLFGLNKDHVEFTDHQNWLTLPLLVKYSDDIGKFRPYGYVGYSMSFLLSDQGSINISNIDDRADETDPSIKQKPSPSLNFKSKREPWNRSAILGGGLKYKYKLNYFFIDARYSIGLNNIVDTQNRYGGVVYRWNYVDDDFRLNNLCISVGYIHPFYKPRKLKKAKSRSILRKIKKEQNALD
jgi:hypothetical protein